MGSIPNLFESSPSEELACNFAMQLASLVALPMTLKSAIELDVFQIIASAGPCAYLSPTEIASRLPAQHAGTPAMLDRMLSLLASYNVLTRSVDRKYGIGPLSKFFAKDEEGLSVAPLVLMLNDKATVEKWYYLKDAVMDGGIAFEKAHHGMSMMELSGIDPRFGMLFKEAGRNHYGITMKRILEVYRGFDDVKSLVCVKGGSGDMLELIIQKHPHIKGINFDLPHVVSNAPAISGVEHVAGDANVNVPEGDAIFLKATLHNSADEDSVKLLKNCWKALPLHGKVILMDCCLPAYPEQMSKDAHHVLHQNLNLTTGFGGKVRTVGEFENLAKEAGFSRTQAACSYCHTWMLEFYK